MRGLLNQLAHVRTFEALQFRDFRLLWLGQATTSAGQWMDQVTRTWLIYQLTDSPLQLGLVNAVRAVPLLFFSVVAGAVADRYGRKAQLVISQVVNAALNFILAVLVLTGNVQVWHVYATGLLAGIVMAFQQPARQAMLSDLVDPEHVANAVGLNSMVFNASRSIAPAIAGLLIAWVDVGGSYVVQGVMYAMSTVWTVQMHDPRATAPHADEAGPSPPRRSFAGSTLDGAKYIWGNRAIRTVMGIVLIPSLLGQPYTSLLPIFARDILRVGPSGQGVLLGAVGAGALVGAVIVATVGDTGRQGLWMLIGALVFGLTVAGFGASPWFAVSLPLMCLSGLCNVTYGTQANTILQTHTLPELRGRVMGIYFLNRGLAPLGSLVAGALAVALGAPLTVVLMGLICAAMALWIIIASPEIRDLHSRVQAGLHGRPAL
ncbi:MAG: hypothetical protein QOF51_1125 [Chloroflexota bacterium]|nr:hypothetical protein [Chloroflexota bacterium]